MKTSTKILAATLVSVAVMLSACRKVEPTDIVDKSGGWAHTSTPAFKTADGCSVSILKAKKLDGEGRVVQYYDMWKVYCPAMDATTTTRQCGKNVLCSSATLSPVTPEEAARQEALSKLSGQDRKALGL